MYLAHIKFMSGATTKDRHVTRMALMDRAATSRALSPELGSFASQQHQDGRIRVWWNRGELTLAAYILYRHTGPSPGVMTWEAIGYTSRSLLVRIKDTLNSVLKISGVLRPGALPFI
ncbi:uncharacterized protein TNCV_2965921 [Trichonephila clavipes]|nr:uncharacterized protein TNCV_2965921 [Trichonephila clavipes]